MKDSASRVEDFIHQAESFMMDGKYEKARERYLRVLDQDPRNGAAHRGLGEAYFELEKTTEGIRHFAKAVEAEPGNASYLESLSIACLQLGRYRDGVEAAAKWVKLDPTSANAIVILGELYAEAGRFDLAELEFSKGVRMSPRDSSVVTRHALAALGNGDRAKYLRIGQSSLDGLGSNPESEAVNNAVWKCVLVPGTSANFTRCLELFRETGLRHEPMIGTYGVLLFRMGYFKESSKVLSEQITRIQQNGDADALLTPTTVNAYNAPFLAMAAHKRGDRIQSKRWLEIAENAYQKIREPKEKNGASVHWSSRVELEAIFKEARAELR